MANSRTTPVNNDPISERDDLMGLSDDEGVLIDEEGDVLSSSNASNEYDAHDFLLITRMSPAQCKCVPENVKASGSAINYLLVWGKITGTGITNYTNDKGEEQMFYPLKGTFQAQNKITGDLFSSDTLYLPGAAQGYLLEQAAISVPFEFACDMTAIPAANRSGYTWVGKIKIVGTAVPDPLRRMRQLLGVRPNPAISAPGSLRMLGEK